MVIRTPLFVALSLMLGACASEPAAPAADDAAATAPTPAPALPPASASRLIAPVRGEAVLDITKPNTRVVRDEIVTTMTVRNASTQGAIAGLRVEENWYNKAGDPVGGDTYRHAVPLKAGEVVVVTLTTPRSPAMNSNSYQFTHANGTIKTNIVDAIEVPEPEEQPGQGR
jgi:hypothetical protein